MNVFGHFITVAAMAFLEQKYCWDIAVFIFLISIFLIKTKIQARKELIMANLHFWMLVNIDF